MRIQNTNGTEMQWINEGDGAITDAIVLDERDGKIEHKDLGLIQPTELDGITINRTKGKISPFIDIRKERLVDQLTGAPSKAFGIWVPDPGSEGGWKDMGTVSENYLLLTNKEVRDLVLEIATQSGLPFRESRIFWDGARFAHVIDFQESEAVEPGDEVGLSLITRSSYDKTWRFEAALCGKRFLCDNGCLSGEFFARVSFRHTQGKDETENWQEVVRQGLSVIESAPENLNTFVKGLRLLKGVKLTDERLREVWKLFPQIGPGVMGKVLDRYVRHEEDTLFGLLNAATWTFWHSKTMSASDFQHNDQVVSGLLRYAYDNLN